MGKKDKNVKIPGDHTGPISQATKDALKQAAKKAKQSGQEVGLNVETASVGLGDAPKVEMAVDAPTPKAKKGKKSGKGQGSPAPVDAPTPTTDLIGSKTEDGEVFVGTDDDGEPVTLPEDSTPEEAEKAVGKKAKKGKKTKAKAETDAILAEDETIAAIAEAEAEPDDKLPVRRSRRPKYELPFRELQAKANEKGKKASMTLPETFKLDSYGERVISMYRDAPYEMNISQTSTAVTDEETGDVRFQVKVTIEPDSE